MAIIISIGYQRITCKVLTEKIADLGIPLYDFRIKPFGRGGYKDWELERVPRLKYKHIPDMGNVNYRGGPTLLKNPDVAAPRLAAQLSSRGMIATMCVCPVHAQCHRSEAEQLIIDAMKLTHPSVQVEVIPISSNDGVKALDTLINCANHRILLNTGNGEQTSIL